MLVVFGGSNYISLFFSNVNVSQVCSGRVLSKISTSSGGKVAFGLICETCPLLLSCLGKGAGSCGVQLQLLGCRPGEDLPGLLVPWAKRHTHPVSLAQQFQHSLQQGHAPAAATQRHSLQRISVGKN